MPTGFFDTQNNPSENLLPWTVLFQIHSLSLMLLSTNIQNTMWLRTKYVHRTNKIEHNGNRTRTILFHLHFRRKRYTYIHTNIISLHSKWYCIRTLCVSVDGSQYILYSIYLSYYNVTYNRHTYTHKNKRMNPRSYYVDTKYWEDICIQTEENKRRIYPRLPTFHI